MKFLKPSIVQASLSLFISLFTFPVKTSAQSGGFAHSFSKTIQNTTILGGNVTLEKIGKDKQGNTLVAGFFSKICDFDLGPGRFELKSKGTKDIYIAKYSPQDELLFLKQINIGGPKNIFLAGIGSYGSGNIYLAGSFNGSLNLQTVGPDFTLTSNGNNTDGFWASYSATGELKTAFRIGSTGGDSFDGLEVDDEGNTFLAGVIRGTVNISGTPDTAVVLSNTNGLGNAFIAKYSSNGRIVFGKQLHASSQSDAYGFKKGADNQYYVYGIFNGTIDMDPGPGEYNISSVGGYHNSFIGKYTQDGIFIQGFSIGKMNSMQSYFDIYHIAIDESGSISIAGSLFGSTDIGRGAAYGDYVISAINPNVPCLVIAKYPSAGGVAFGFTINAPNLISPATIAYHTDGSILIAGHFKGQTDFDPGAGTQLLNAPSAGSNSIFFAKYSSTGALEYARMLRTNADTRPTSFFGNNQNELVLAGNFSDAVDFDPGPESALASPAYQNLFLARYSASNGSFQSLKTAGNTNGTQEQDEMKFIKTDSSGNYYIIGNFNRNLNLGDTTNVIEMTGTTGSPYVVAKYNSKGTLNYGFKFDLRPYEMNILSAQTDYAGNLYLLGTANIDFDANPGMGVNLIKGRIFLLKYNPEGQFLFGHAWKENSLEPQKLQLDVINGKIILTGKASESFDIDPGPGVSMIEKAGTSQNLFIARFDTTGLFEHAFVLSSEYSIFNYGLATDKEGDYYLSGYFNGMMDFDPGPGVKTYSIPMGSSFLAKYTKNGDLVYGFPTNFGYSYQYPNTFLNIDPNGDLVMVDEFISGGSFSHFADINPGEDTNIVSSHGRRSLFWGKYDSSGKEIFHKIYQGTSGSKIGPSAIDAEGNIIITGTYFDSIGLEYGPNRVTLANKGTASAFFAKYTPNGDLLFAKEIVCNESFYISSVSVNKDGVIALAGLLRDSADFDPGPERAMKHATILYDNYDAAWATYDKNGQYLASVLYNNPSYINQPPHLVFDQSGLLHVTGEVLGSFDFDPGPLSFILSSNGRINTFIASYSVSGNFVNAVMIDCVGVMHPSAIMATAQNELTLVGIFNGTANFLSETGVITRSTNLRWDNPTDIYFARFRTSDAVFLSVAQLGTAEQDKISAVAKTANNTFIIAGNNNEGLDLDPGPATKFAESPGANTIYLAEYTPAGTLLNAWTSLIFHNEVPQVTSVAQLTNGSCWIGGSFMKGVSITGPHQQVPVDFTIISANFYTYANGFLAGFSNDGKLTFAGRAGNIISKNEYASPQLIKGDPAGNTWLYGTYSGIIDFDPGSREYLLSTNVDETQFIAKYGPSGNLLFVLDFKDKGKISISDIEVDNEGCLFIFGGCEGLVDIDFGNGTANVFDNQGWGAFFAKYSPNGDLLFVKPIALYCSGLKATKMNNGEFYLAGNFERILKFPGLNLPEFTRDNWGNEIFVARYKTDGTPLNAWHVRHYNFIDIQKDNNGNFYLAGYYPTYANLSTNSTPLILSNPSALGSQSYLAKYDSTGKNVYAFGLVTHQNFGLGQYHITVDPLKGSVLYYSGYNTNVDIDPGPDSKIISVNNHANFIAKYDSAGKLEFEFPMSRRNIENYVVSKMVSDENGDFYITGAIKSPFDFDPGPGEKIISNREGSIQKNISGSFLSYYKNDGTMVYTKVVENSFPNYIDIVGNRIFETGNFVNRVNISRGSSPLFLDATNFSNLYFTVSSSLESYKTVQDGTWHDPATWENGLIPKDGQAVTINHIVEIFETVTCRVLKLNPGSFLYMNNGAKVIMLQ